MECLGRSITPRGQAFVFASLCLAHRLILSYQKSVLPLLFNRVFLFGGQVTRGCSSCCLSQPPPCHTHLVFWPQHPLLRELEDLGVSSFLQQIACDRVACFKDSISVSLRVSSPPSSSNILGGGIPTNRTSWERPVPKPAAGWCEFLSSKRRNSLMGCLCPHSKVSP